MKGLFGWLVAAVIVAGLLWTGIYFTWHIRITGALRTMESQTGPGMGNGDALEVLRNAGCRALPYIVDSLQPAKNPYFLNQVTNLFVHEVAAPPDKTAEWQISSDDSTATRETKCAAIRNWWREHGSEVHQGWRVWSSSCKAHRTLQRLP